MKVVKWIEQKIKNSSTIIKGCPAVTSSKHCKWSQILIILLPAKNNCHCISERSFKWEPTKKKIFTRPSKKIEIKKERL